MKQKNIKIKDIAEKLGVSPSAVSQQIANPNPTINWLNTIAKITGVRVTELLADTPETTQNNTQTKVNGFIEVNGVVYTIKTPESLRNLIEKI